MIRPTGCHDDVTANSQRLIVRDFRVGIGQRKNDGVCCHALDHRPLHNTPLAQPQKHIGSFHRSLETFKMSFTRKPLLRWVQPFSSRMDVAFAIKDINLIERQSQLLIQINTAHRCSSSTTDNQPNIVY